MTDSRIQPTSPETLLETHHAAFDALAQFLVEENQKYNLTRLTDPEQVRCRHFLDSLAAVPVLDALAEQAAAPLRIIDVGSGAGFPALPLAIVRPAWTFCSLEATAKKVHFQQAAVERLGLTNLHILHGRAEALAHTAACREQFDVACARALAAMPILAELLLGFVKPGGQAIFWKGPGAQAEAAAAGAAVTGMGAAVERIVPYTLPDDRSDPVAFSLVVCRKHKPAPKLYPRAFGIIKRKPLAGPGGAKR